MFNSKTSSSRHGSGSHELLGLALPGIGNQKGWVELDQDVLDGFLALLIKVFLIVCYEGFGECLPDGVDLSDATTTLHADPDVNIGKTVLAQKQKGFLELVLESLGFNLVEKKMKIYIKELPIILKTECF